MHCIHHVRQSHVKSVSADIICEIAIFILDLEHVKNDI